MDNLAIDTKSDIHKNDFAMKKPLKPLTRKNWVAKIEDVRLMKELQSKLGVGEADVIRISLRKLADSEGIPRQD